MKNQSTVPDRRLLERHTWQVQLLKSGDNEIWAVGDLGFRDLETLKNQIMFANPRCRGLGLPAALFQKEHVPDVFDLTWVISRFSEIEKI